MPTRSGIDYDNRDYKDHIHRDRIIRRIPITHSRLQKGMVIFANYTPSSDEYVKAGLNNPKEYLLLILNKNYDGFVHAVNLDLLQPTTFDWLCDEYGLKYIYYQQKNIGVDIPAMKMDLSSKRFYDRVLRELANKEPKFYRRMTIEHFNYFHLVDYNFPEELQNKYLYGLGIEENNPMTIDKFDYVQMTDAQKKFIKENKYKGLKYKGIPESALQEIGFEIDFNEFTIDKLKSDIYGTSVDLYQDNESVDNPQFEELQDNTSRYFDLKKDKVKLEKQRRLLERQDLMKNIKKKK